MVAFKEPGFRTRQRQAYEDRGRIKPQGAVREGAHPLKAPAHVPLDWRVMHDMVHRMELRVEPMFGHKHDLARLERDMLPLVRPERDRAMMEQAALEADWTVLEPVVVKACGKAAAIETATKVGKLAQALRDAYATLEQDFGSSLRHSCATSQPHASGVKSFMANKGWRFAGGGYFSMVFVKGDLAIKLGMKAEDSGAAYAAFARENAGLKGLPEVFDMQHHGRNSYTVIMPKYVELNEAEKSLLNAAHRSTGYLASLMNRWSVGDAYARILSFFNGMATIDLHGENVMKDEHGNFIITDPVSFKAGALR